MDTVELLQFSFKNALDIFGGVTADLTPEQADWQPPGIAHSIGTLYWHVSSGADYVVNGWCVGGAPLSQTAGWEEKVVLSSEPAEEGDHAATVRAVRVVHRLTEGKAILAVVVMPSVLVALALFILARTGVSIGEMLLG